MQGVRQLGRSKNPVIRVFPSFRVIKYDTTMTTVDSEVKFSFPCVHPDTHMRKNQGHDWGHGIHYAMTQIYMKSGMKTFVTRGVDAVSSDIKQLHLRNTFETLYPRTLSKGEYHEVLESRLFLKEKRDKTFKLIVVYGVNKKRGTIDK